MYNAETLWEITCNWLENKIFDGTLRISDIPRELRIAHIELHVLTFRCARNLSATWFTQALKLLEYDLLSTAAPSREHEQLLDLLDTQLCVLESEKGVIDFEKTMDEKLRRELHDRRSIKQALFKSQLGEWTASH